MRRGRETDDKRIRCRIRSGSALIAALAFVTVNAFAQPERGRALAPAETEAGVRQAQDALARVISTGPLRCIFEDNFQDLDFWTLDSGTLWHQATDSACAAAAPGYASAPSALAFNDETLCNYDTGNPVSGSASMNVDIVLPSNALGAVVQFKNFLELERAFDTAFVEVSTDGGGTWQETGFRRRINTTGWTTEIVDLASFIGETIRIRFRFDSFDAQENAFTGWYVDDVQICTTTVPPGFSGIFLDDVELNEGSYGATNATFNVRVDPPNPLPFGIRYRTVNDSARTEDPDYVETIGTLFFNANEASKTIDVPVVGDPYQENDEEFLLQLSDLTGGGDKLVFANTEAHGLILNDDTPSLVFEEEFETLDVWTASDPLALWHAQTDAPCIPADMERPASLAAYTEEGPPNFAGGDYLTQEISGGFPLSQQTIVFTPQSTPGARFYDVCIQPATAFPTNPENGTPLSLSDDSAAQVTLGAGEEVEYYGTTYSSFYVGSNGYITFSAPDSRYFRSLLTHFEAGNPRISPLFTDLNPPATASEISTKTITNEGADNRVAVTYSNVSQYGFVNSNNFQVELFFDGRIRITWLQIDSPVSITGLSRGTGFPVDFQETRFIEMPGCPGSSGGLPVPALPCAYLPDRTDYLTLNDAIPLPPGTDVFLRWRDFVEIEDVNDRFFVEISSDQGATWNTIYDQTVSDPEWNSEGVDISAYSGLTVGIRFGFASDATTEAMGWLIDWVRVDAVTLPQDYSVVYVSPASSGEGDAPNGRLSLGEVHALLPLLTSAELASLNVDGGTGVSASDLNTILGAAAGTYTPEQVALATQLSPNFTTLDIGERELNFIVHVVPANPHEIRLDFSTMDLSPATDFTATADEDYPAITRTLVIPANQASSIVRIPIIGDSITEGDEVLQVNLEDSSANAVISVATANGTIENDDAPGGITIAAIEVTEGDSGLKSARFTLGVNPPNSLPIAVDFETVEGTALRDIDYVHTSGRLEIDANSDRAFVLMQFRGDVFPESDETVFLRLSNPSIAGVLVNSSGQVAPSILAEATILNDDTPVVASNLDMEDPGLDAGWVFTGQFHFQENSVCITPPAHSGTRTLAYNLEALAGAGVCGYIPDNDFADTLTPVAIPVDALTPTLSWWEYADFGTNIEPNVELALGNFSQFVTIHTPPTDSPGWRQVSVDLSRYVGRSFNVRFTVAPGAGPAPASGVGWYIDDLAFSYVSEPSSRTLNVLDAETFETNFGETNLVFKVNLNDAAPTATSISYAVIGGTAVEGEDFRATSGVLDIPAGGHGGQIAVPVIGDLSVESNEDLSLVLASPGPGLFVLRGRASGLIKNDDYPSGTVFGINGANDPHQFYRSSIDKPNLASMLGATPSGSHFTGGDFAGYTLNDFYGLDNLTNGLYTIDSSTGVSRRVASLTLPATEEWAGIAWDLYGGAFHLASRTKTGGVADIHTLQDSTSTIEGRQPFFAGYWAPYYYYDACFTPYPLAATAKRSRTQVIYTAADLGAPRLLNSLALRVESPPGVPLQDFTVRIQPTALSEYPETGADFVPDAGWTNVYQHDEIFGATGWATLLFDTPFNYTGGNLLIDFSFVNTNTGDNAVINGGIASEVVPISIFAGYGYITVTYERPLRRVLTGVSNDTNSNPLAWPNGVSPGASLGFVYPDLRIGATTAASPQRIDTSAAGNVDVSNVLGIAIHPVTRDLYLLSGSPNTSPGGYLSRANLFSGQVQEVAALNLAGQTAFTISDGELDFDDASGQLYMAVTSDRSGSATSELFRVPISDKLDEPTELLGRLGDGSPTTAMGVTSLPSPPGIGAVYDVGVRSVAGLRIEGFRPGVAYAGLVGNWMGASGVGDINADGHEDFMISTPSVALDDNGTPVNGAGETYLIFGGNADLEAAGRLNLADFDETIGVRFPGLADGGGGFSVAGLGDINGDDFLDFAISSPFESRDGVTAQGVVYVVYGRGTWPADFDLDAGPANGIALLLGSSANSRTGASVSGAGDVNGDGLGDIVIGAPDALGNGLNVGVVHVVFGSAGQLGGITGRLALGNLDGDNGITIYGPNVYIANSSFTASSTSDFGVSVAGAGDVDGDGYDDLLAGDNALPDGTRSGSGYLIYGGTLLDNYHQQHVSDLVFTQQAASFVSFDNPGDLGWSVSAAGDINGDGLADLLVGQPAGDGGNGAAHAVFGGAGLRYRLTLATLGLPTTTIDYTAEGLLQAGISVAGAGDVQGDGFADVLIGGDKTSPGGVLSAGAAFLVFGNNPPAGRNTTLLNTLTPETGFRLEGALPESLVGRIVSHAGDVNGDGFSDYLAASPGSDPNGVAQAGELYLVYGGQLGRADSGIYKSFMRSGVGTPPAQGLPAETFEIAPRGVGMLGDGSHNIPLSHVSIGFHGGGTGTDLHGVSAQEVTIFRGSVPPPGDAYVPAKVHWKVLTDRRESEESTLRFWYTQENMEGLSQPNLDIFYTPDTTLTASTQWRPMDTVHNLEERSFTVRRTHDQNNPDISGFYALMQLDLRFELGREIPPPFGVDVTQVPPFGPEINGAGGAFWHNKERKLYATRPGAIEVKWSDALTITGICIWPTDLDAFQVHVANTPPVNLLPDAAYQNVQLMFSEFGTGVTEELVNGQGAFAASGAGRSLVMLSSGAEPQGSDVFFLRVRTVTWDEDGFLFDGVPATIGQEIEPAFNHNPLAGGPFLYFEMARVNQQADYYNRETRTGPIIPVNLDVAGEPGDDIVIVYYGQGEKLLNPLAGEFVDTESYWPVVPVRYVAGWPANPSTLVIAKQHADQALNPAKFSGPGVYVQNEAGLPGFNPNEEHAFVAGGVVYALRDDLNQADTSEPYVLVTYADATASDRPKIEVFEVLRELPAQSLTLDYSAVAGQVLQAPVPLQILNPGGLCGFETTSSLTPFEPSNTGDQGDFDSPIFRDRLGILWARRAADDGGTEAVDMFYYYPSQSSFFYPAALYPSGGPVAGDCVPWLDFADGTADSPITAHYTIEWPDDLEVATLEFGRTLAQSTPGDKTLFSAADLFPGASDAVLANYEVNKAARAGEPELPLLEGQCSVSVLYDQADANGLGASVRLFDYAAPRRVALAQLPDDVVGKLAGEHTNLIDLPPHLFERLRFIQGDAELEFRGVFIDIPTGEDIVLPNVLTEREYYALLEFSTSTEWADAIDDLYQNQNDLIPVVDSEAPPFAAALTTAIAAQGGYVTLALGNNPETCSSGPVSLHVIKVDCPRFVADIAVVFPNCVFDQQLTMRYGGDFAGAADDYLFEWIYLPDDGQDPRTVPIDQWLEFPLPGHPAGKEPSRGAVDVTISGPSPITLSDNYFRVRYVYSPEARGTAPTGPCDPTSDWSDVQLAPGWIKRVVGEINPFTQRAEGGFVAGAERKFFQYHEDEVNTVVSMLTQAGPRFEGAVGLNCDNLNDLRLIPTYETVSRMGRDLSIDSPNPYDFPPASNALLLVTSRIADLYTMLGNEAFGDASDPTIGFGTNSGNQFAEQATSIHAFMNQAPTLLSEELMLLRGRDNSSLPGTDEAPIYNRFYPNFSTDFTGGQVAYVLNYGITDVTGNGSADVNDALIMYPQGHGDAWGHYLTAVKAYYSLFAHPVYVYTPRAETVLIGSQPVSVDFLDERKFALAASYKARTGAEIVDLAYRERYSEDPNEQFLGYNDTDLQRAWGVSEWAMRAGQGALFDWAVANALLPEGDPQVPPTIQKIDRDTVTEIREIASAYSDIQAQVDKANAGLNPLNLAKNVVPFDIDPARIDQGESHFEQVYGRAVQAMVNAITVFNHANESTQRLREQQDSLVDFQRNVVNEEQDFKSRLIELFGYPYEGDIGPGKTYPAGYDGPDVYHFDYFDPRENLGMDPGDIERITITQPALDQILFNPNTPVTDPQQTVVTYHVSMEGFGTVVPDVDAFGERRATGEIQVSRQELFQAIARYWQAVDNYSGLIQQAQDKLDLLEAQTGLNATELSVANTQLGRKITLNDWMQSAEKRQFDYRLGAKLAVRAADAISEGIPKFLVAGLAVGFDATSVIRGIIKGAAAVTEETLNGLADKIDLDKLDKNIAEEELQAAESITLTTAQNVVGVQGLLGEIRETLLNETTLRYEIYMAQENMVQQIGSYKASIARAQRELDKLLVFRRQTSAQVEQLRYRDMAFRIFRNDALQKYRAQFDMAARYVYLAAQAYDYETNLLRTDSRSGQQFMDGIIRSRSLGLVQDGIPVTAGTAGDPGLADPMARLILNWDQVLEPQLGFNNPQTETNRFSLRSELFRILPGRDGNEVWRETLARHVVPNVLDLREFQRFCRPFDNPRAVEPAIVLPFSTSVSFGQNFFGWPLAGGDSAYDSTNFATKVRSVGLWFSNYNNLGSGMSNTPRVYLVPVGSDVLRSPASGDTQLRQWRIIDQKVPVPFPLGQTDFLNPTWVPVFDGLADEYGGIRQYSMFRAFHDSGSFNLNEVTTASRLIGRSVANTEWLLIIPAGTLSADRDEAIQRFIYGRLLSDGTRDGNGVSDIKLFFQTYAISGN